MMSNTIPESRSDQERIDSWIRTMETQASMLLDYDVDALSAKERADAAHKTIALISKLVALRMQLGKPRYALSQDDEEDEDTLLKEVFGPLQQQSSNLGNIGG